MATEKENKTKSSSGVLQSGVSFGIISAVAFGTSPFFAKNLYFSGFDVDSVLFVRFLPALFVLGILTIFRKYGFRLSWKEGAACLIAGGLFCATSFLLFLSYQNMDIGIAATLLFLYPIFVVLLSAVLFKEKLTFRIMTALLCAVAGVAMLSLFGTTVNVSFSGFVLAILAAICYAGYQLWVAKSETKNIPAEKLTFYVVLICCLFYTIRIRFGMEFHGQFSLKACENTAGISLVGALLAMRASAISLQRCGATITSVLGALEPFTAVLIGITVFHEAITGQKLCGIFLVITSVICIILRKKSCKTH